MISRKLILENESIDSLKPIIFDLSKSLDKKNFYKLTKKKFIKVVDEYGSQLFELFSINNPSQVFEDNFQEKFAKYKKDLANVSSLDEQGRWIYLPWRKSIYHVLKKDDFQKVRTSRNKYLISEDQQKVIQQANIGVVGLSVGNSIALGINLQGSINRYKFADNDTFQLSNANRALFTLDDLGKNKALVTAQEIYQINPYVDIDTFPQGLTDDNIRDFFEDLTIIIDEVDNLSIKYKIRKFAKRKKIPVIMATDNANGIIVDIERYDLDLKLPFFYGRLKEVDYSKLINLSKMEVTKIASMIVGEENISKQMVYSLEELGKTLISWPQLGRAALLNSSVVAYCIEKILTDKTFTHSRIVVNLDTLFN